MQMWRVVAATVVVALVACGGERGPIARIHSGGRTHDVAVEVVDTPAARARGLMYRTSLAHGSGMYFVFEEEIDHAFWMKNTLIPLDIVFIAGDGTIVGIHPNARPLSLASLSVGRPSRYALEVPGGWTEKNGVRPGDKVELLGVAARREP